MKPDQFVQALHDDHGIVLNTTQEKQFAVYFQLLVEWNKSVNLTTLTAEEDVYLKHFYDSLSVACYHEFIGDLSVCDVGAGAGFPGIPLKICFPELRLTIVDSSKKRIHFLEHLINQLGLQHVAVYHDRAETFGRNQLFREFFDCVISRAVARMQVLSELCLPLVKLNGYFLAMKGSQGIMELNDAKQAINTLGGIADTTSTFRLPEEESVRSIITIHKRKKTPKKYPRKPGTPNKEPLH